MECKGSWDWKKAARNCHKGAQLWGYMILTAMYHLSIRERGRRGLHAAFGSSYKGDCRLWGCWAHTGMQASLGNKCRLEKAEPTKTTFTCLCDSGAHATPGLILTVLLQLLCILWVCVVLLLPAQREKKASKSLQRYAQVPPKPEHWNTEHHCTQRAEIYSTHPLGLLSMQLLSSMHKW